MTEPTKEFKDSYEKHGGKPKGSGQYSDAWYWFQKGRLKGKNIGHHDGFQDAREQRAHHDLGHSKP